jgi:5'-nucleotidase / UDP-sugar diphosphatase
MNLMGYDAMALGEGDLTRLGVDRMLQLSEQANFDFLSANVVITGTDTLLVASHLIVPMGTQRVAIIGLTGTAQVPGVEIRDPVASVREVIDRIQGQADTLILLSHAGMETHREIAEQLPEIDLIISGGGKMGTQAPEYAQAGPIIVQGDVASPGHAGRKIGLGVWSFDAEGASQLQIWQSFALGPTTADDPELLGWTHQNR